MTGFFSPDNGSELSRQLTQMQEVVEGLGLRVLNVPVTPAGYTPVMVITGVSPGGSNVALEITKAEIELVERAERVLRSYSVTLEDGVLVGYTVDYPVLVGQLHAVCRATVCVPDGGSHDNAGESGRRVEAPGSLTERVKEVAQLRLDEVA